MEYKKFTNEELALMYNENNDELAFEEVYNRFKRMRVRFRYKHLRYNFISKDDLLSLIDKGFLEAVKAYNKDKKVKLSTMIYKYIQGNIAHRYDYMSRHRRKEIFNESVSIYSNKFNDGSGVLVQETLVSNLGEFNNSLVELRGDISEALKKSLNVVKDEYKPYILPIIIGDYEQKEVAEMLGVSRQAINRYVLKFKQELKKNTSHLNKEEYV